MTDRSFFALTIAIAVSFAGNADAADRHVKIINSSSTTMKMFFASNSDVKKWEEDILGDDVLLPGEAIDVNIDDGTNHCVYDFRASFSDGAESVKHDVNVRKIGNFYFND